MTAFVNLFSPVRIGSMKAKNRLLMSAMSINFGVDDKGWVNEQLTEYFVARARGGVGMMLVGGGAVHPTGLELPQLPALWDDGCIPALEKMVAAVKPFDCCFGVQLMHGGRQSYHDKTVAPSPIPALAVVKSIPKELTIDGIHEMVNAFGDAARRCYQAGFDFIEIHGGHGYLINQFMAPNSNKRTDVYGGSFKNRIRFLLELFRDIKSKCGADFPVGVRINGKDYIENGWTLEEALKLSVILEKEGADYLHISAGIYGSKQLSIPSMYVEHGCFTHLAAAIKNEVSIPVVAVGRIKTPELADLIIKTGKADIIAMGRALLADPELPQKARTGNVTAIRPCIGCCLGCIHAVLAQEPGGCVVNPDVGREYLLKTDEPAAAVYNVLVTGAGPAGMAAARMAALRGHRVTVCEQNGQLGGALRLAAAVPGRSEINDVIKFLARELQRLNVEIRLNTPLSDTLIRTIDPDTVILATGSLPDMPMLKGLFKTKMDLCTVTDVLDQQSTVGDTVIVLGGNQTGLVLADYLSTRNKTVAVLHRKAHFAEEMSSNDRYYLRERLKQDNITLYKPVVIDTFLADGVQFHIGEESVTLKNFDTVVIADNMTPVREAANLLRNKDINIHIIGDAKSPRHLMYAMNEAEEIGRTL